ncbi:1-(5-phosphoribosyl)-5-[(5-phosphoribosylamino)methylideneamino] imidazole-4-carboxamide isomerase [Methylacidimicrobium sp. AP8]|uniref:1-(5-phosphoribosyl)-5-[(5- phosphoribosylamino)methylideneamino]imidazole-4- carboxamide isomerase n=1 Tax=Methylacidimicrobium sp. AP8 TaxID=2730359 RepID=UPI0018C168ED|nr:1-(5-phosphoribosyl)-5-[(5-phosphoribosylamino)methylideneamino] imidazole-4-carboxamide isomerase [Methylacidimicrobium sp. AP8]CAB4244354.1 1-(5-phosphoribosyl)-5-[(5-phosphoribosylamino)methylideneamino] imidazole-4-carboxamide isomerase [Methylacidimicrobium sp. AP8]
MKLFAAIDILGGKVVRLRQGKRESATIYSEDPLATALRWEEEGADGLHIVDLEGAFSGVSSVLSWVEAIAGKVRIPIQLGGGLRTTAAVAEALRCGASRAVIGTRAWEQPELLPELAARFGSECIVVALDARNGEVQIGGWEQGTGKNVIEAAWEARQNGAGFLLYTDVSADGMLSGPDLVRTRRLVEAVRIPVFASGGIGKPADLEALRRIPGLYGAVLGRAIYEKKISLRDWRRREGRERS